MSSVDEQGQVFIQLRSELSDYYSGRLDFYFVTEHALQLLENFHRTQVSYDRTNATCCLARLLVLQRETLCDRSKSSRQLGGLTNILSDALDRLLDWSRGRDPLCVAAFSPFSVPLEMPSDKGPFILMHSTSLDLSPLPLTTTCTRRGASTIHATSFSPAAASVLLSPLNALQASSPIMIMPQHCARTA